MKGFMCMACSVQFTSAKKITFQRRYISNYSEMSYNKVAIRGSVIKTASIESHHNKAKKETQYNER